MIKQVSYGKLVKSSNAKRENEFPSRKPNKRVETVRIASLFHARRERSTSRQHGKTEG